MKTPRFPLVLLSLFAASLWGAPVTTQMSPGGGGKIVVEATGVPAPAPLFFTASAEQVVRVGTGEITGEATLSLRVVQGAAEVFTLGLAGDGEVTAVTGAGLRDWSVRSGTGDAAGRRFLDLRPSDAKATALEVVVRTRLREPAVPGVAAAMLVSAGDAVGFASRIRLGVDPAVEARVAKAEGVVAVEGEGTVFVARGEPRIELALARRGAARSEAELVSASLTGTVDEATGGVVFQLKAQARAARVGARLRLLSGRAAPSDRAAGDGWHVELVSDGKAAVYELVFDKAGAVPVELVFAAGLRERADWRRLDFTMPAGAVVPVTLAGLAADGVEFARGEPVVPMRSGAGWQGFVPADGTVALAWRRTREAGAAMLSFTGAEQTEVRVGAGLLRQSSQIAFRVLQGKLDGVRLRVEGPGEIVGVEGANVLGWSVEPAGPERVLVVRLSRPIEGEGVLTVRSQSALGGFPVRAEPVRLTPEGAVRHAGFVRVANAGAVRLEVAGVEGMMQLAPEQFPGGAVEAGARQVFVYRFPSADHDYRVLASQIMPEVGVSVVTTYELTETDRIINADLELDVREAPLRDWSLEIPEDYAVVGVQGAGVADYAVESAAREGRRTLKVIFAQAVQGRQLVRLRLEKNQAAGAGEWTLPALVFPGAKSVRGHVGVVSAPGYRLTPTAADGLVEVPLGYFPRQMAGLQQAWRLREADWAATMAVEALGQSVQADVFHLYSLKEGVVYGSVLINYFVIGAPASEWRIEVPESVGNIDVTGQGVRREWRREGDQVIVSLHQPVLGAATLLVTFEQPMSARGGVIQPGEVRPLGVQSERGYLQVVSPLQVKNNIRRADGGLLKLEPGELPAELRLLTSSPSLAVYQYTARPFALELGVDWYQPGETVDQLVDFAKLSSQVARDGQVVTEARFFVKTRGSKALRLELPAGARLWESRVDGEVVNARADGGRVLVPLPARLNPNEPVDVVLRLGQAAGASAQKVVLTAPKLSAPMVIGEWTLRAESGRLLVPAGGDAALAWPNLTETGFEWIATRGRAGVIALMALAALLALTLWAKSARWVPFGLLVGALAVCVALGLAVQSLDARRVNARDVAYAATVVPAESAVTVIVDNVPAWRAMVSLPGLVEIAAGVALCGFAWWSRRRGGSAARFGAAGAALLCLGVLSQRLGAPVFFGLVALALFAGGVVPSLWRGWRGIAGWRRERAAARAAGGAVALTAVLLAGLVLGLAMPEAHAKQVAAPEAPALLPEGAKAAQSLVQRWELRDGRLFAEAEFTVRGGPGDSFLLLSAPAVLTGFTGEGLRVGKVERDGRTSYHVSPEREGLLTAKVTYELAAPDLARGVTLPTGPAAVQRVTVSLDEGGWDFGSPAAIRVTPTTGLAENRSGATLVLGPQGEPVIRFTPRTRDLSTEATRFYVETATLFTPAPGVVNGTARVTVRPVQGRVDALELDIPEGFTVGEVGKGPVGAWSQDPATRRLRLAVEPAQSGGFAFTVEFQRGTAALPYDLTLRAPRLRDAAGEVGMLALAFGGDAQPEAVRPEGLSPASADDFDASLLPKARDGSPLATLQNVYRNSGDGGALTLRVAPVDPEVRVVTKQVFSIGTDRLVLAADLNVAITRVGLFKLSFALPEGLEIESLSGPSLSHWTEADEHGRRVVTMHLNGRTIGAQAFTLTLAGPAPAAQAGWTVPRVTLREATRQTGEVQLVPEKGLRLQAQTRTHVSQLDPRTVGNTRPGALAFRLLQEDWSLAVGIEALEPWVTVQALQEVTAREGQTLTRLALRYKVENAALKSLRVRLPGLTAEQARTVRATGAALGDFVAVAGDPELWEARFQRGIVGETDVLVEFQALAAAAEGGLRVETPVFEDTRQATLFVAVRGGGRLELQASDEPRGWQRVDWTAVPTILQDRAERGVPALAYRVAEPERPLSVSVRRHEVADALKLRVTGGGLTTVFSPAGAYLTAAELKVEVLEKSTLRVRLPEGARLFNTFVNGESLSVVREGDAYLFHVSPDSGGGRSATVRLVYAMTAPVDGRVTLQGPGLNVPLEDVSWRVVLPPGYSLDNYAGGLRLREDHYAGSFGLGDYQVLVKSRQAAEAKQANDFITEANLLLRQGRQQLAGEALSRASKNNALDLATNEDARVQLRALKTQQAVVGLNTRRQKLYLDNSGDAARNVQLEQAANQNPLLQGRLDYDPAQADQLLMGNTADENTALRGIASRIVDQQLAAEPAPSAIDVTVPEKGRVLTFTRALQVDGGAPLELRLDVSPERRAGMGFGVIVLLAVAAFGALAARRRAA